MASHHVAVVGNSGYAFIGPKGGLGKGEFLDGGSPLSSRNPNTERGQELFLDMQTGLFGDEESSSSSASSSSRASKDPKRGLFLDFESGQFHEADESSYSSASSSSGGVNHAQAKKNKRANGALFDRCKNVAARVMEDKRGEWSLEEIQSALFAAAIEYWQHYEYRFFEDEKPYDKAFDLSRDGITEHVLMKLMTVGTYSVDPKYATNPKKESHRPPLLAVIPVRFTNSDFETATLFEFIEIVSLNYYLNIYDMAYEKMLGV